MFHNRTNGGETRVRNVIQVRAVETYDNAFFGLVNNQGPQRDSPMSTEVRSRAGSRRGVSPDRQSTRTNLNRSESALAVNRMPTTLSMEVASGPASEHGRYAVGMSRQFTNTNTEVRSGYEENENEIDLESDSGSEYSLDELNPLMLSEMRAQQEQMEDQEFNEQMRLAEQESLWEAQLYHSSGSNVAVSPAHARLQETQRNVSNFHRAKLAAKQSSAQALSLQRMATNESNRQQARGTPAHAGTQGIFSVHSSARLARQESRDTPDSGSTLARAGTRDAPGLGSSNERPTSPSPRVSGASRRERQRSQASSPSTQSRLPNQHSEPSRRTQLNSSYQTVDVQPGQRVRIVIDGQGVWVDR